MNCEFCFVFGDNFACAVKNIEKIRFLCDIELKVLGRHSEVMVKGLMRLFFADFVVVIVECCTYAIVLFDSVHEEGQSFRVDGSNRFLLYFIEILIIIIKGRGLDQKTLNSV